MVSSMLLAIYIQPADIWFQVIFLYMSLYLPIYVVYSEKVGVIWATAIDIEKEKDPFWFRATQSVYLAFSLFTFVFIIGKLT